MLTAEYHNSPPRARNQQEVLWTSLLDILHYVKWENGNLTELFENDDTNEKCEKNQHHFYFTINKLNQVARYNLS